MEDFAKSLRVQNTGVFLPVICIISINPDQLTGYCLTPSQSSNGFIKFAVAYEWSNVGELIYICKPLLRQMFCYYIINLTNSGRQFAASGPAYLWELATGVNTLEMRSVDALGNRGPVIRSTFAPVSCGMEAVAWSEHDAENRRVTKQCYTIILCRIFKLYRNVLLFISVRFTTTLLGRSGQGNHNSAITTTKPIFFPLKIQNEKTKPVLLYRIKITANQLGIRISHLSDLLNFFLCNPASAADDALFKLHGSRKP